MTFYPAAAAMSSAYADPVRDSALVRTAMANLGVPPEEVDERLGGDYEGQPCTARVTTLSAFLREVGVPRIDLLKVDVERAELDVLEGIDAEDWSRIGQVAIEVHGTERAAAVERLLARQGFRVIGEQDEAMKGTSVSMLYAVRA